ncbi:3743_t:CDS:2, partial [Gigaspora rosea]
AAIPQENIHNPLLVDANLIKLNIGNRFMAPYGLLHNQRWGFRTVDDGTRLEELTVHSYDVRLQEKRHSRSMKNVVLIDLQENQLHSMDEYIEAINTYIERGHMIPLVADWPGQIHLRTAILRYLMYKYIFGPRKPLAQTPKPWHINLLLEISRSAWQEISKAVKEKFGSLYKDAEYLALKDLLDNSIPLVLDIYAVFFRSGDYNTYLESCFHVWTLFFRFSRKNYTKAPVMFLSDIFYWESTNHPILE